MDLPIARISINGAKLEKLRELPPEQAKHFIDNALSVVSELEQEGETKLDRVTLSIEISEYVEDDFQFDSPEEEDV